MSTLQNEIYGMKIRLAGLIRRGEDQEKIDTVRAKLAELKNKAEGK